MTTTETVTGEQIVKAAREYLGVPFKPGGRSREGIDCVGLAVCVGQQFGLSADLTGYGDRLDFPYVDRTLRSNGFIAVEPANLKIGDLIVIHVFNQAAGVAIVSGLDGGRLFRISKIIQVEAEFALSGRSRKCVTEDGMSLGLTERMTLASFGIMPERAMAFYRYPFATA